MPGRIPTPSNLNNNLSFRTPFRIPGDNHFHGEVYFELTCHLPREKGPQTVFRGSEFNSFNGSGFSESLDPDSAESISPDAD